MVKVSINRFVSRRVKTMRKEVEVNTRDFERRRLVYILVVLVCSIVRDHHSHRTSTKPASNSKTVKVFKHQLNKHFRDMDVQGLLNSLRP